MRWLAIVALAGCSTQRTYVVNTGEVRAHLGELVTRGEAKVETFRTWQEDGRPQFTRMHEIIRLAQQITIDGKPARLADLTLHCENADPALGKDSPCALIRFDNKFIELHRDDKSDVAGAGHLALALLFLGGSLGGTVCTFACDYPYNLISAGAVVVSLLGALALCSSTPGCHD